MTPTPSNTPSPTPTATPATVTVTYNFRTAQNGWVPANGVTAYSAGNGFVSTGYVSETWGGSTTIYRRPTTISLCTENNVRVVSAEALISISGASYANHNFSSGIYNGLFGQGTMLGNQDTGTDITFTLSPNLAYTQTGVIFDLNTADPPIGSDAAAFRADVAGSAYTIKQLVVTYSTGQSPIACASNTSPTVTLDCPADATVNTTATIEATTTGVVNSWEWEFGDGNTSSESDGSVEFSWPIAGTYTIDVSVFGPGGSGSDSCEITVYRIGQPRPDGSGALYRPIHTSDTNTTYYDGLFSAASAWFDEDEAAVGDVSIQHTVIGLTEENGMNVYAVADGEILSITPLNNLADTCEGASVASGVQSFCNIAVGRDTGSGTDELWALFAFNPSAVYRVRVSYVFGYLDYYVTNAPQFVREGQILLAGCIVGQTVDLQVDDDDVETDVVSLGGMWLRAVQEDGQQWPILPQLYMDPNPDTACNAGGDYSDCLFDPLFQRQGGYTWQEQGTVTWSDGVTLQPGASISLQGLNLDAATAYSFTVWTERPRTYGPNDARVTLGIGTTETSFFITESIRSPWAIASATHTADQGSLYSIRITNSGRAPFTVLQNCVTTGEPNTTPSSCYFQNFTFDGQLTNWTTTGTVIPDPSGPLNGQIAIMSDLATIGQNVTLYADGGGGDHEYTVRLEGVLHATANSQIQVRYRYGGGGWILPDVNGWTLSQQSLTALQRTYVLEFDVPSGTFAGLMEFQFDFTATGGDVIGSSLWLSLYSLCLQDAGGFSHHPGGGGSGWTPGTGCDSSAPPAELQDDFGAWIAYHLDGMQDIYYCDVIPQLERLNNITYGIYEYAQWSGLYSQAAQAQAMLWADKQLFPWLGGYLSNIANAAGGRITVDPGGGCHDLFCLLDAIVQSIIGPVVDIVGRIIDTILSLINTAANLIIPLLEAIIGFFVTIINGLAGILNSLITLITAFITGISNAQPAPVPGLPNCAIDPSSNAICAVMYGLQETVFADEGAAIIPLFIGILSIVYLQWLISKIAELIAEVTDRI